jgi:hypothetical protein
MKKIVLAISLVIMSCPAITAAEVASVRKFMNNASFDAWDPNSNQILFMRKDAGGILQLYLVREDAKNPEREKKCISCEPPAAIGIDPAEIPLLHKGASDWHPSGEWFITEMEIPNNISWAYKKTLPGLRVLAEPGAGWWNNLYLVKSDGSLWIKLTDFMPADLDSGVLYPKFSKDGNMVAWAERIGGAAPFDKYPFAQWILKTAQIDLTTKIPYLYNVKDHPLSDGAIFEPQEWSHDNKLLFAADSGYSELPYPGYRLDIWEVQVDSQGNFTELKNLTQTSQFYEEQSSYVPDGNYIAFVANHFDLNYEKRLNKTWEQSGSNYNKFIVKNLSTDLYLMDRSGQVLSRLTWFARRFRTYPYFLVTRSAWSADGQTLLIAVTTRSTITGKILGHHIYKIRLK